jgi:hypothetical protein
MIRRNRLIVPLFGALLLAGCYPGEQHSARFEQKWPAGTIRRLEVREVSGAITVDGDSPSEIRMLALVRARGVEPNPREENQGYFRTKLDGDTLAIGTRDRHHGHFFFGREIRVDYELHVPPSLALELRSVNGRIATRGIAGEISATTVNGTVDLDATGASEVAAKTVNGRVQVRFLDDFHGARLSAVNGRVTASLPPAASFFGDFTQVNGDFEAAFPLSIHSNPGSRRVSGEVNGGRYALRITTVNGDIKIDHVLPSPPTPPAPPAPPTPPGLPRT